MRSEGDGTRVTVTTDLTVTGKVAQFGRGVLADISSKLIGQFVDALEADLRDHGAGAAPDSGQGPAAETPAGEPVGDALAAHDEAGNGSANGSAPFQPAPVAAAVASQAAAGGRTASGAGADVATTEIPAATPSPPAGARRIDHPEPEPVNLLDAAGGSVAKRFAPVAGVAVLVLAFLAWRRRRARRSS